MSMPHDNPPAPPALARQLTLRHLRGFLAVARHASFSRAARELSLTQPALSATIRDFEALLGTPLFERSTHHVALTPAGQALLPQAQWLLNSFVHGALDIGRTLAEQSLRIHLAALPSAMHLLAPALAAWKAAHPEAELVVRDLLNDELVEALRTGEIDIAVGADIDLPTGISTWPVAEDELVALLPPGHRLARRRHVAWRDLHGERLALFSRGSTYDLAAGTLRQHGIALDATDRLRYSESLYSLVRSGLAVGLLSRLYTYGIGEAGLKVTPLRAPAITRRIVLMVRKQPGPRHAAAADCLDHLRQALGRQGSPAPRRV